MPTARSVLLLASRLAVPALALSLSARAQLSRQIASIAAQAHGRVGVACSLPGKALDCGLHASDAFPMQSVYKLPIAVAVLHAVEQGRLSLTQSVHFVPSAMVAPDGYSPLRDEHPRGAVSVPIEDLLRRAIAQSDNAASDELLRTVGGPAVVDAYLRSLRLSAIQVRDSEKAIDRDEQLQYRNSAEPRALVTLLRRLADRSPLSAEHTGLLLGWMTASHTGDHRLKALLPPGTVIADKTGTSGQGRKVTNATNDIGLITLPNGQKLAIAVLVADSAAPAAEREHVIAEIAQAVWTAATHESRVGEIRPPFRPTATPLH